MLSVILLSMLMIILYSKCDQASDPWKHLQFTSEFESDLRDTVDLGKKWLPGKKVFCAGKKELVSVQGAFQCWEKRVSFV